MRQKLLVTILTVIIFITSTVNALAIYDPLSVPNNKLGIHILEPAEIDKAAELVNTTGGDWGYVTIPIRANDRNLNVWTQFMTKASQKHLIPILRIASFPVDDHWMAPNQYDLIDFANFLNDLPWPTKNRYVIVYNEPNHENEWGGFVFPQEYARVLDLATDIFHRINGDFFVIMAGFDSSAPDSSRSMNEYRYMELMNTAVPGIFGKIDAFSSHAYGNPGFSSYPTIYSSVSVANYRFEERYLSTLGIEKPKIFITEAGWRSDLTGIETAGQYYQIAFQNIWTDDNLVAITPFVLNAPAGPFTGFSFMSENDKVKPQVEIVKNFPKIKGEPILITDNQSQKVTQPNPIQNTTAQPNNPIFTLIEKLRKILHF